MKAKILSTLLVLLNISVFAAPNALAALDTPSRDQAGAEQARFEKEEKLEKKIKNALSEAAPPQQVLIDEQPALTEEQAKVVFTLKDIKVTGNDSIGRDQIDPQISEFIGKSVRFRDLQQIGTRIKNVYRSNGFIAVYVYMPPQDVTSGVVEFAVVEGKLGNISVSGNKWFSERIIKKMLRLTPGSVVTMTGLKRGLAYINKNQDIKTKGVLKPGAETRTTDVNVDVKDKFPYHLSTDVNNLGTDNTGRTRWGVAALATNLLGQMDQLSTRFQLGSRTWAIGTSYNIPINSMGTSLGYSYSHSSVDVGGDFKALDIEGTANTHSVDINQEVLHESIFDNSVYIEGGLNSGFDFKSIENKILGAKAGHDELRILNVGVNLEENDNYGKTYFPHTFSFGFSDFLGASDNVDSGAIRRGTGGQFFIYRSSLARYTRLPFDMTYAFRSQFQLTPDTLPSSEQLRLGGAFSVRGYAEGDYLADYGAFASNDIYIPTYFFPKDWKLPYSSEPLRQQIQGVAFFDFGGGQLRSVNNGEDPSKFLVGMGGGLRVHLFDRVYGRFQWGGRLGDKAADGNNGAFYYGISAEAF